MKPGAPAAWAAREDVRVVEQPIEQRGDGGGIAEELASVLDGPVRGDERPAPWRESFEVLVHGELVIPAKLRARTTTDDASDDIVRPLPLARCRAALSWSGTSGTPVGSVIVKLQTGDSTPSGAYTPGLLRGPALQNVCATSLNPKPIRTLNYDVEIWKISPAGE